MTRKNRILMISVILAAIMICAMEFRSATTHVPGLYKGINNPLLARQLQKAVNDHAKLLHANRYVSGVKF